MNVREIVKINRNFVENNLGFGQDGINAPVAGYYCCV